MSNNSQLFADENATRAQKFETLLASKELADCSFVVGEEREKIAAHRLFLSVMSPVFYAMFYGGWQQKDENLIPDLTVRGFKGMLQYVYTEAVQFSSIQHAVDVLATAKKYLMPNLERECFVYLKEKVTPDNCLELFELANDVECALLEEYCTAFIRTRTGEILACDSFVEARDSTVQKITVQDELNIESELDVIKNVERWVLDENKRRGKALEETVESCSEIICNLRFLSLSAEEFISGPAKSRLLSAEQKASIHSWFAERNNNRIPPGLSGCTQSRRTSGTFSATFSIDALLNLFPEHWIYSEETCSVKGVPWKVGIDHYREQPHDLLFFNICTEDENKSVQVPSVAKIRVTDENGGMVEVYGDEEDEPTNWFDAYFNYFINGHLNLRTSLIRRDKLMELSGAIKCEVSIKA